MTTLEQQAQTKQPVDYWHETAAVWASISQEQDPEGALRHEAMIIYTVAVLAMADVEEQPRTDLNEDLLNEIFNSGLQYVLQLDANVQLVPRDWSSSQWSHYVCRHLAPNIGPKHRLTPLPGTWLEILQSIELDKY